MNEREDIEKQVVPPDLVSSDDSESKPILLNEAPKNDALKTISSPDKTGDKRKSEMLVHFFFSSFGVFIIGVLTFYIKYFVAFTGGKLQEHPGYIDFLSNSLDAAIVKAIVATTGFVLSILVMFFITTSRRFRNFSTWSGAISVSVTYLLIATASLIYTWISGFQANNWEYFWEIYLIPAFYNHSLTGIFGLALGFVLLFWLNSKYWSFNKFRMKKKSLLYILLASFLLTTAFVLFIERSRIPLDANAVIIWTLFVYSFPAALLTTGVVWTISLGVPITMDLNSR